MAEIKHTFTAGRMNKDLDERLVPNGEYRDAQNIQVRTTDGSDAGTVQNLQGNEQVGETTSSNLVSNSKCIGSIADEKNGKAYFMFASEELPYSNPAKIVSHKKHIDYIVEQSVSGNTVNVVNDVFGIAERAVDAIASNSASANYDEFTVADATKYSVGMKLKIYNSNKAVISEDNTFVQAITGNVIHLNKPQANALSTSTASYFIWEKESKALGFSQDKLITGINILDDFLMWTCGSSEPRKINIPRFKAGTPDSITHTQIQVKTSNGFQPDTSLEPLVSKNLIDNGSFDKDISGWTAAAITEVSLQSNKLRVKNIGGGSGTARANFKRLVVEIGDTYTLTASAYKNTATSMYGAVLNKTFVQSPTLTNDGTISLTFTAESKYAYVRLFMVGGDQTYAEFDNVVLSKSSTVSGTDMLEEHTTVIKKAPKLAPSVKIKTSTDLGLTEWFIPSYTGFIDANGSPVKAFTYGQLTGLPEDVAFKVGDAIDLTSSLDSGDKVKVKARVVNIVGDSLRYLILSISSRILATNTSWSVKLEEKPNIFEKKFCRFAYRYKYTDGEYSSFSPWSSVGFSPGSFEFDSKNGYNLGMVNNAKEFEISNFVLDKSVRPNDIISVDILVKTTDDSNVYVVKTVNRENDPEWLSGKVKITTDSVDIVLPEDQSLRTWDNVPTTAKSQEIISNRLLYGNYSQGYDVPFLPSIKQSIISENSASIDSPEKSIKSMRSYKVGVVYEDKYGRQTPVISKGIKVAEDENISYKVGSDESFVSKSDSINKNKIQVQQDWSSNISNSSSPEKWMEHVKYYVKETSSEYYNLVMDRWYDAKDGNVWLSFLSADRNKITDDTYIVLKSKHGEDAPVLEEAKYKPLDIVSEAPDYIKSTKKSIGKISIPDDYYDANSDDVLDKLTDSITLKIEPDDYAVFNSGKTPVEVEGILKLRLVAESIEKNQVIKTSFVEVGYFQQPVEGDFEGEFRLNDKFGSEADFYQILKDRGVYSSIADAKTALSDPTKGSISYELVGEVKENKPEFDGKFFVKINRDIALDRNVLRQEGDTSLYEKSETLNLAYIDTQGTGTHPSTTGPQSNYAWGSYEESPKAPLATFGKNPLSAAEMQNMSGCNFSGDGRQHWEWYRSWSRRFRKYTGLGAFLDSADFFDSNSSDDISSTGNKVSNALSSSDDAIDGTYDVLTISTPFLYRDLDQFTDGKAFSRILKKGTIFGFGNDSSDNKYIVKSVSTDVRYNFAAQDDIVCRACEPGDDIISDGKDCIRSTYKITFERLGLSGIAEPNTGIDIQQFDPRGFVRHDGTQTQSLDIYDSTIRYDIDTPRTSVENPAMFETEPLPSTALDIYYEASNAIPLVLDGKNVYEFAPLDSKLSLDIDSDSSYVIPNNPKLVALHDGAIEIETTDGGIPYGIEINDIIEFEHSDGTKTRTKILDYGLVDNGFFESYGNPVTTTGTSGIEGGVGIFGVTNHASWQVGMVIEAPEGAFPKGTYVTQIDGSNGVLTVNNQCLKTFASSSVKGYLYGNIFSIDKDVFKYSVDLPWFNCYSFGNGVESDRIRDDFNSPTIGKGFKASSTFSSYEKEYKTNSLIYSSIYNPFSGFNGLNQFNLGVSSTKDINPAYGPIQALKTKDTNINVFTENKVLKVLANKDALYNADGNPNLVSSNRILGQAIPYTGDFGISKNPESLAQDQYRIYFTDKQRGAVLRLSNDGLTPISNVGMKTWFRDNLRDANTIQGSFDIVNGEYNLTITPNAESSNSPTTVSFNEAGKGWVSFKTFILDNGISIGGKYLTTNTNKIWQHYSDNVNRNTFYNTFSNATLTTLLNDLPGSIKNFKTINYEGSQGKSINVNNVSVTDVLGNTVTANDNLYDNITGDGTTGWSATVITNSQNGVVNDFRGKESKWFGYIVGDQKADDAIESTDLNEGDFSVQGLGVPYAVETVAQDKVKVIIKN